MWCVQAHRSVDAKGLECHQRTQFHPLYHTLFMFLPGHFSFSYDAFAFQRINLPPFPLLLFCLTTICHCFTSYITPFLPFFLSSFLPSSLHRLLFSTLLSMQIASAVSGKTNYLVAGTLLDDGRPVAESSKYRTAIEKKVPRASD